MKELCIVTRCFGLLVLAFISLLSFTFSPTKAVLLYYLFYIQCRSSSRWCGNEESHGVSCEHKRQRLLIFLSSNSGTRRSRACFTHSSVYVYVCVYIYRFMDTCLFVSQHLTDVWAAWGLCNSLPLFDLSCGGKHLPPIFSHFSYTCWTLLLLSAVWLKSPLKKLFESTLGTLFRGE